MWFAFFLAFAYASTLTVLLPLWAGWRRWPALPAGRRWMVRYLGFEFLVEALSYTLGRMHRHNLWVLSFTLPVETALLMLALSEWQVDARTRIQVRWLAGLSLLFLVPSFLAWEPVDDFSLYRESAQGILCLAVAAYTAVRRSLEGPDGAARRDWFWICAGIMLYFAAYGLLNPLARLLHREQSLDFLYAIFGVRGALQTVANLLFLVGMRCPIPPPSFGLSSSPPRSWPQSSSSPSAPR